MRQALHRSTLLLFAFVALSAGSYAASFTNGNFETGDATGWTIGGGYRGNNLNPLNPADYLPGGVNYSSSIANGHSGIVTPGSDANTGNQLNRVYSGTYSWRVEDTTNGGYASVITQTVNNYTDANIFFAWAAVLEGAHDLTDAATVQIDLKDLTTGMDLITREYNAATSGGGVDPRFQYDATTNFFWTPWQIEQLTLPVGSIGHDFALTILAADCQPTGHTGYLYLDGFGAVTPPTTSDAPEPGSFALIGLGLGLVGWRARRRMSSKALH